MTQTPTDKVRAALERAEHLSYEIGDTLAQNQIIAAKRELEGKVLVPVDQSWQDMKTAPRDGTEILVLQTSGCVQRVKFVSDDTDGFEGWVDFQDESSDWEERWFVGWQIAPMIAPYVKGEKE